MAETCSTQRPSMMFDQSSWYDSKPSYGNPHHRPYTRDDQFAPPGWQSRSMGTAGTAPYSYDPCVHRDGDGYIPSRFKPSVGVTERTRPDTGVPQGSQDPPQVRMSLSAGNIRGQSGPWQSQPNTDRAAFSPTKNSDYGQSEEWQSTIRSLTARLSEMSKRDERQRGLLSLQSSKISILEAQNAGKLSEMMSLRRAIRERVDTVSTVSCDSDGSKQSRSKESKRKSDAGKSSAGISWYRA